MMFYPAALTPATILVKPGDGEYRLANQRWLGIPAIERTRGGMLVSAYYGGGIDEGDGNYVYISVSRDRGVTWEEGALVIRHTDREMRAFDPCLWLDPLGRLWIFWAQSHHYNDGRAGTWCVMLEDPDSDMTRFTEPRRLFDGVMINKPVVLKNGTWLLLPAVWKVLKPSFCYPVECHPELDGIRMANVFASTDQLKTVYYRGGVDIPERSFDEHHVVELGDGTLWLLNRRFDGIGQSFSSDGGYSWHGTGHSGIANPSSKFFVRRLRSGRLLMVNHVNFDGRNNLTATLSADDGKTWQGGLLLDGRREVSYPDGFQDEEGRIIVCYDFNRYADREILFAEFTEEDILAGKPVSGCCRLKQRIVKAEGELPPPPVRW